LTLPETPPPIAASYPSVLSGTGSFALTLFLGGRAMKNGTTNTGADRDSLRSGCRCARFALSTAALILVICSSLFARVSFADELHLLINGKAVHINAPAGSHLNEKNWGMGFQYDLDPIDKKWVPFITSSGFEDSNKNPSYYAGGGVLRRFQGDTFHFDAGIVGFVMTRKGYKNDEPFLGALPAFSAGTRRVSVNMTYIPKVEPKVVALWFFQLKINLGNFR
jgi:Antimicrobial peptide resistance and lipid A acylation protein PagP